MSLLRLLCRKQLLAIQILIVVFDCIYRYCDSVYWSSLPQLVSTLLLFSPSSHYPFVQYAQSILFSVLSRIQLNLHIRLANLFPHHFLFSNSHLDFFYEAVSLPHYFPFKHSFNCCSRMPLGTQVSHPYVTRGLIGLLWMRIREQGWPTSTHRKAT